MEDKAQVDPEVEAIRAIVQALDPLDGASKQRVVRYVLDRLDLSRDLTDESHIPDLQVGGVDVPTPQLAAENAPAAGLIDIRSLVAQKRPKSAVEMATLIAHYLADLSPERKSTVNTKDLEKYFKQGAYPLPKALRVTLFNASQSGFLESVARGEYKLTPVGHNLVVHKMPSASEGVTPQRSSQAKRSTGSGRRKKR